ncbi:MAG: Holliday junction branch migration protein RuvA [Bacillota bacterium]|jgi:Holliday junction DNA helicase RuvA
MISELSGIARRKSQDSVTVDVNGVGFDIMVTPNLIERIDLGSQVHLFTRLIVKDDGWSLYGFGSLEERTCFDLLQNVKGIGPKLALGILSALPPDEFYRAVLQNDERVLTRLPGVGKKTAARIVVELRDRIGLRTPSLDEEQGPPSGDLLLEAVEALTALGYSWQEARNAVEKAMLDSQHDNLEKLLREALRRLARV